MDTTLTLLEHDLTGIRVVREYGEIPPVVCYPGELNQVWMNLLSNAAQAIPRDGSIIVRTAADNEEVRIEIADSGVGIPCERIKHLFEPGFSSHGERVKAGMGLFISHNIVRKHRGNIKVKSESGKGSTFIVVLPVDFRNRPAVVKKVDTSTSTASRCSQLSG
ncbi:MAG: HAMP domain-containing histidine kinase [bacterium]|nr:HAMP domain-containing histidine kinase [bacterium]